jgi:hypothetical protein
VFQRIDDIICVIIMIRLTTDNAEHTEKWEQTHPIPSVLSVFSVVNSISEIAKEGCLRFSMALALANSSA